MPYFAVQVRTGRELDVKAAFLEQAEKREWLSVCKIHALVTYIEIAKANKMAKPFTDGKELRKYLKIKRVREQLRDLRYGYLQMKDQNEMALKEEYKQNIKKLEKTISNEFDLLKKVKSLLSGYIIVQLSRECRSLPSQLYHIIESIEYVIRIPSIEPVPLKEVEKLYKRADQELDRIKKEEDMIDLKKIKQETEPVALKEYINKIGISRTVDEAIFFTGDIEKEFEKEVDTAPIQRFMDILNSESS